MSASPDLRPTVHILCGPVGAGKSTYARRLQRSLPAVRFSLDEWMLRLYGLAYDDPAYAARLPSCINLIWDVALQVLALGVDVVLDWNQWSRSLRAEWRARANAAGFAIRLHHLDVPLAITLTRLARRLSDGDPHTHAIPELHARHFLTIYEPPGADEGIDIVRVAP